MAFSAPVKILTGAAIVRFITHHIDSDLIHVPDVGCRWFSNSGELENEKRGENEKDGDQSIVAHFQPYVETEGP